MPLLFQDSTVTELTCNYLCCIRFAFISSSLDSVVFKTLEPTCSLVIQKSSHYFFLFSFTVLVRLLNVVP